MKRFLLLSIIFLLSLVAIAEEPIPDPDPNGNVYSCNGGRIKIGALQTDLQQAKVCLENGGGGSVTFVCTGGTRMTAAYYSQDMACAEKGPKRALPVLTPLTEKNIFNELSTYFSVNYSKCYNGRCEISVNGSNITSTISKKFSGVSSMVEEPDSYGTSIITVRLLNKKPRVVVRKPVKRDFR